MAKDKPSEKGRKTPPVCKAILLCERVIVEVGTNRPSIIGVIGDIYVSMFPARPAPMWLFLELTSGDGRYAVTCEIRDRQSDDVIANAGGPVLEFTDRADRISVGVKVPSLLFERPGDYDFLVLADRQEIDRQTFRVTVPATGG